jgi:hypothetical protein
MAFAKNISLQQFGRLLASFPVGSNRQRETLWACVCNCGNVAVVSVHDLLRGNRISCGCRRGLLGSLNPAFKHGGAMRNNHNPAYASWASMLARCTNPKEISWKQYGGAGITVCERWREFNNFLVDTGERPAGTSLGRFGDVGNYSCGVCAQCTANGWTRNCAWQTMAQQMLERQIKRWNKQLQAA